VRTFAPTPLSPPDRGIDPPSFSIVISAYQAADTIGTAVQSALDQAHAPLEVIVVDDGSTDDTHTILESFGDRITVIRKQNGGGASARNVGVAAARGEFVAVLDADDAYGRRRLECLAQLAIDRPDLDILTTDARFISHGHDVGRFQESTPFAIDDQRTAIFDRCFVGGWPAVRLSRLRAIGGFDEHLRIAYDWDCWLRLILAGAQAGMVDEAHYDYHLGGGTLSAKRLASLWERVAVLEKAAENPSLRREEAPVLATAIRFQRTRAAIAEAQARGTERRRLVRLASLRGIGLRARVCAVAALVAPVLARRLIEPESSPVRRFDAG
jgi:GT2 family glycosyltransferase